MTEPSCVSWSELVNFLSNDKSRTIRTLDTVFLSSSHSKPQWYFTNKSGSVSKKKDHSSSIDSILDRFSRFALSNPCNTEGIIGVVIDLPAGVRKWMKKENLESYLKEGMTGLDKPGSFLQVYLRPLRGSDVLFTCESHRINENNYEHEIIVVHQSNNDGVIASTGKHEVTEDIYTQITSFSQAIIGSLLENNNLFVDQLTIECIVDDNQQAWLSSVSRCETSSSLDNHQQDINETENVISGLNLEEQSQELEIKSKQTPSSSLPTNQEKTRGITKPTSGTAMKKDIAERKKAKKNLKTGDSGFKRSASEVPPSIELIAKFAAEKERQERLINQNEPDSHTGDSLYNPSPGPGVKKKKTKEIKGIKRSHSGNAALHPGTNTGFLPSLQNNIETGGLYGDPINQLDATERHLEELQKRASAAAAVKSIVQQQQQQQQGGLSRIGTANLAADRTPLGSATAPPAAFGSVPSTRQAMSGSEAEFLVRQIHSATDLSQLSMFSNADDFHSLAAGLDGGSMTGGSAAGLVAGGESIWSAEGLCLPSNKDSTTGTASWKKTTGRNNNNNGSGGGGSMADVMSGALQEKLTAFERQVGQLHSIIASKEAELEKKDAKIKKLANEVDILKRDTANDIRRLTSEHELTLLKLKEVHSKEKAALLVGTVPPATAVSDSLMRAPSNSNGVDANSDSGGTSSNIGLLPVVTAHEANNKLIQQIDILRTENRRLQEQNANERRNLMVDHSNKLLTQEKEMKSEIIQLRSIHTGYEDRISQLNDELNIVKTKVQTLENMNQQLEVAKKTAVEEQYKLRSDLKNIQQSIQASYRLETVQGITSTSDNNSSSGGGGDNTTTMNMRINDSKNDAKIRQYINKIEFLKLQLETEQKNTEDLKNSLNIMYTKIDELKNEHNNNIIKLEKKYYDDIEQVENNIEMKYSERMNELTLLQSKYNNINKQLNESNHNELILKKNDDHNKNIIAKNNMIQITLNKEIEELKNQINKLNNDKEMELLNNTNKISQESIIRRLDNERIYLKNQLTSEITHKNELNNEYIQIKKELNDINIQWNNDIHLLKEKNNLNIQNYNDMEIKYKNNQINLENELNLNIKQNNELKNSYIKIREQLNMKEIEIDNININKRRLQELYDELQNNMIKFKKEEEITINLYKNQINAMNETIKEQENNHNQNIIKLKNELSEQYLDNANTQNIIVKLKNNFQLEKLKIQQITSIIKCNDIIKKLNNKRIFYYFCRWYTNNHLINAAKNFRKQVEHILKKSSKDMYTEKLKELEIQKNDINNKNNEYMKKKEIEWESVLNDAMKNADETKIRELDNAKEEYHIQLKQIENDYIYDLNNKIKEYDDEIILINEKNKNEIIKLKKEFEMIKDNMIQNHIKDKENELLLKEQEMNHIMLEQLQLKEDELTNKHNKYIEKLIVEHDFLLHQKQLQLNEDIEKLKMKLESDHNSYIHTLTEQHTKILSDYTIEKEKEKESLKATLLSESEELQSKLRADMHIETEKRIRELRSEWQEEFDNRYIQQRNEFDLLLATKIDEYGKTLETEKQRAIKLEGSKWKQALKDSTQNYELQTMKIKAEVANNKDNEMYNELQKLSNNYEVKRKEDLENHQISLENIRRDHAIALERQDNTNKATIEKLRIELEIKLKEQYDLFWSDKMKLEISVLEQTHKQKLAKEQSRMDQLKQDFSQQSQNFALERSNLQRQVNQADERILQIEAMNKTDTVTLRRKHDEEKRQWEEEKNKEFEKMEVEHERKMKESNQEVEKRCQEDAERQLQEEARRLNEEMDRQVGQMQDESEKLISGLEQAMNNLRSEKTALTTELEGLSNKLEETEDCLYDLQQECKRVKMDSSLAVWKSVTKIFQMRQRFQEGISQFDKDASKRYEEIKREMQIQLDHTTLTVLKLAALLQDSDTARITTQSILTSHRTPELIANRNKIQVMERDLERLTMEKDSLEEQKELIEGDIHQMEAQVRELEDLIRSHNQESSMSNGRINVAHARKKRRLDSDLEQLLESIEQKRHTMSQMDRRVTEKGHERDDLEMELIDVERKLVEILLEQQKMVLSRLDEGKMLADRTKVVLGVAQVTYPVPAEPTMDHVLEMGAKRRAEEARIAALENDEQAEHDSLQPLKGAQHTKGDIKKLKG